jgi:hypothetical protein
MSQTTTKSALVAEAEASAPGLLDQIVGLMERRERAVAHRPQPIEIKTFDELERWAQNAAHSGMVPKDYAGKPAAIIIAVDMGAELGLKRMQSLQGIAVINGRPSIWGDAMWALILSQPTLQDAQEWYEGDGDQRKAVCEIKRAGRTPVRKEFSVSDAKKASLWGKQGPWQAYSDRMLQMRARAFSARDAYADALKGLQMAEEVMDYAESGTAPREAVKMSAPVSEVSGPSEKTRQTVDALINQITSCEAPEEWLDRDGKSAKYRERLKDAYPELSAQLEAAFTEARERLFPEPETDEANGAPDAPAATAELTTLLTELLIEIEPLSQKEVDMWRKNATFAPRLKKLSPDELARFEAAVKQLVPA